MEITFWDRLQKCLGFMEKHKMICARIEIISIFLSTAIAETVLQERFSLAIAKFLE
jgi:hypothetical protein